MAKTIAVPGSSRRNKSYKKAKPSGQRRDQRPGEGIRRQPKLPRDQFPLEWCLDDESNMFSMNLFIEHIKLTPWQTWFQANADIFVWAEGDSEVFESWRMRDWDGEELLNPTRDLFHGISDQDLPSFHNLRKTRWESFQRNLLPNKLAFDENEEVRDIALEKRSQTKTAEGEEEEAEYEQEGSGSESESDLKQQLAEFKKTNSILAKRLETLENQSAPAAPSSALLSPIAAATSTIPASSTSVVAASNQVLHDQDT